ncbi:M23 family metallopeptidase [Tunturiibacter empetritectus]|uniref:Murein DD-endopeptidase MepM/ murein hydrolase activator NlpD n=1 Tax=Tunturiibacter lichenicola TaxID=2051959 RepID=A0A852VEE5_9BACT|nr:murein DD-endopeptidase MepM/ murein hydrolase activator NlpD [Edaphobacter lichenicola]
MAPAPVSVRHSVLTPSLTNRTLLRAFLLTAVAFFAAHPARCSLTLDDSILIAPSQLSNGSPFLITVSLPNPALSVTGNWQSHQISFFPNSDRHTWYALAGVDVELTPGNYPLTIEADLKDKTHQTLHQQLTIETAPYLQVPLTVPDKFVQPDPKSLRQIAADKIVKDKAFATSAAKPLWTGNFLPPLRLAPQSDSFGNQRLFNGKVASVHRGLDYHAKLHTPVAAINSGRVVLARPLYFEGGCVIIDHGLGLMSVYMHLSKIEVSAGRRVRRGQIIALSGASGRATGPHLHLGVRWQGSYLDPAKLYEIQLPTTTPLRAR